MCPYLWHAERVLSQFRCSIETPSASFSFAPGRIFNVKNVKSVFIIYFFIIIILIPLSLLLKIFGLILILHQESHALRYLGILNIFEQFLAHHSALTGLIRFTSGESDLWPPVAACGLNLAPWIPMRKRCAPCAHPIGDPWGRAREIEGSLPSLPSLPWFRLFLKIFKGNF